MLVLAMMPRFSLEVAAGEVEKDKVITTPIEISNFKMNKKEVIAGDTLEYSFTIKDIGIEKYLDESTYSRPSVYEWVEEYGNLPTFYGSDTVYLYWKSTGSQKVVQAFEWKDMDKEKGRIELKGEIPVQKGMESGTWRLAAIYFEYEGKDFYVKDKREKVYKNWDEFNDEVHWYTPTLDLSIADFTVKETVADNAAPTLNLKSLKLSKKTIKKNQKSTFSLKVKDASKIAKVECVWVFYEKSNKSKKYGDSLRYYTMNYNKKNKAYQCTVKFPRSLKGNMKLLGIQVRDIYGNEEEYYSYKRYWNDYERCYEYTNTKNKKYYNAYKNMTVTRK